MGHALHFAQQLTCDGCVARPLEARGKSRREPVFSFLEPRRMASNRARNNRSSPAATRSQHVAVFIHSAKMRVLSTGGVHQLTLDLRERGRDERPIST
jgi:hypothetical protein